MTKLNFDKAEALLQPVLDYAKDLSDADKLRVAAYLVSAANCVQQYTNEVPDNVAEVVSIPNMDEDDPMPISYHLHNACEDLADVFDSIAVELDAVTA